VKRKGGVTAAAVQSVRGAGKYWRSQNDVGWQCRPAVDLDSDENNVGRTWTNPSYMYMYTSSYVLDAMRISTDLRAYQ